MNVNTRYQQDDETVARQLGFLLAKGLSRDAALEQLELAVPVELHGSFEHLVTRLEPSGRDPHLATRFVRRATELGGEPGKALASMLEMSAKARILADSLYRSIKPGLLYVAALSVGGFLISLMFLIFIWPQMSAMFAGMNASLPALPAVAISLGFFGFPLIFLLVMLLGVLLWVVARVRSRQLAQLLPLQFKVFNPKLRNAGNDWLTLGLCEVFQQAGIRGSVALDEAKSLLGTELKPDIGHALVLALKTDTFNEELRYQVSQSGKSVETAALTGGQRELTIITVVLYVLIAIAIVSFYQPIFYMAKVV